MDLPSKDRDEERLRLLDRIERGRQRFKRVLSPRAPHGGASGKTAAHPAAPHAAVNASAGAAAETAPGDALLREALAQIEAGSQARMPQAFPRSHTMRWLLDHPGEAAAAGVALAALLAIGPRRVGRWIHPHRVGHAGLSFMRGMREGMAWARPLLPIAAVWMQKRAHAQEVAERDDTASSF